VSEDRKPVEPVKTAVMDERWQQLCNYRKAKGLCSLVARNGLVIINLRVHVVQEMLDFLQTDEQLYYKCEEATDVLPNQLMCLSSAATGQVDGEQTLQIIVDVQGVTLSVLIDSGSTHSFINASLMHKFSRVTTVKPTR
jgi:hypothetical protein